MNDGATSTAGPPHGRGAAQAHGLHSSNHSTERVALLLQVLWMPRPPAALRHRVSTWAGWADWHVGWDVHSNYSANKYCFALLIPDT